jgi:hypothetical protein
MGVLEAVEKEKLPIAGDMSGHPAMSRYISEENEIEENEIVIM